MGLGRCSSSNWNTTTKSIRFRNRILDNLSFKKVAFSDDADFSHSSFVNATFIECCFSINGNYSFDGCDLENCTFMDVTASVFGCKQSLPDFFEMIKKKKNYFLWCKESGSSKIRWRTNKSSNKGNVWFIATIEILLIFVLVMICLNYGCLNWLIDLKQNTCTFTKNFRKDLRPIFPKNCL